MENIIKSMIEKAIYYKENLSLYDESRELYLQRNTKTTHGFLTSLNYGIMRSDYIMDKYEIARAVRIEDFKNAMECMDFSPDDYTEKELAEMFDTFEDLLANDDTYNSIYSETLYYVLQKEGK